MESSCTFLVMRLCVFLFFFSLIIFSACGMNVDYSAIFKPIIYLHSVAASAEAELFRLSFASRLQSQKLFCITVDQAFVFIFRKMFKALLTDCPLREFTPTHSISAAVAVVVVVVIASVFVVSNEIYGSQKDSGNYRENTER